jgi:hypothetical protein
MDPHRKLWNGNQHALRTALLRLQDQQEIIEALRAYRTAVGRRTREIVKQLRPSEMKRKNEALRVKQAMTKS